MTGSCGATRRACAFAKATVAATSAGDSARTTATGFWSTVRFQASRASSQSASPRATTSPSRRLRSGPTSSPVSRLVRISVMPKYLRCSYADMLRPRPVRRIGPSSELASPERTSPARPGGRPRSGSQPSTDPRCVRCPADSCPPGGWRETVDPGGASRRGKGETDEREARHRRASTPRRTGGPRRDRLDRLVGERGDPAGRRESPLLQPIDAQKWVDQAELTWDAYTQARPTPGTTRRARTALSASTGRPSSCSSFEDQPMLITQPAGSHPFGNPQAGCVGPA